MSQMGGTFVASVPAVPVGSMQAFAGSSAPTGWLLCNGTTASRTTYSNLYSVIGTTYGVGDGSTTFGLPDMRGRVPMGAGTGNQQGGTGSGVITGGTSLAARTAGQFGGDERGQAHAHALTIANSGALPVYRSGAGAGGRWITTLGVGTGDYLLYGTDDNQINANTAIPGGGMLGTGGNMPPFVVLNYIIKALPDTPRGGMTATYTPPIVTSLPLVPQFGDQVVYAADATNGVYWLLQYDASGTYPWKFIGGAPLQSDLAASTTAAAGAAAAGGSPSVAIALPGNYVTRYGCLATPGAVVAGHYCAIQPAFAGAVISGDHELGFSGVGSYFPMAGERAVTFASAGTLSLFYRSDTAAGTSTFIRRYISATPVRVKAA